MIPKRLKAELCTYAFAVYNMTKPQHKGDCKMKSTAKSIRRQSRQQWSKAQGIVSLLKAVAHRRKLS